MARDICFVQADEAYAKNKDDKMLVNNIKNCLTQYRADYFK